jgi:hypothetical protein
MLALAIASGLIGILTLKRKNSAAVAYLLSGSATVGCLLYLEMVIVMSTFVIIYHAPLVLWLVGSSLMGYQAGANAVSGRLHRWRERMAERENRASLKHRKNARRSGP